MEHTEEHSDGHTWTSGSNTHTEQHGTPLDGRGGFYCDNYNNNHQPQRRKSTRFSHKEESGGIGLNYSTGADL